MSWVRENRTPSSTGGCWKRGGPVGHLRVPGRCAERCHHDGLVGTQPIDQSLPRQRSTLLTFQGRFLRPRPRALVTFKDRVRERTRRKAPVSLRRMIEELNPLFRGWGNYFAAGDVVSLYEDLDKWVRMRLRSKARRRFKSKGGVDNHRWPIKAFDDLGLVNLERLVRARKLSPA